MPGTGFSNGTMFALNGDFTGSNNPQATNGLQTDNQVWLGSTALNAGGTHINVKTLTAGSGITFTPSAGALTISTSVAPTNVVQHLTGNTGGQLNPDGSNNFNTLGTGSITIAGSGSTLTTQLTGLTNHSVLLGAGTATINPLTNGTTGQVLTANTGADPSWQTPTSSFNPATTINDFDDFIFATFPGGMGWNQTGFSTVGPGTSTHPGIVYSISTAANAGIGLSSGLASAAFVLGAGTLSVNFVININALSTVTNRYILYCGFANAMNGVIAAPTDGFYFKYSDNLNSGNWIIETINASTPTTSNSNSAVATGWVNLGMTVNAAGTSIAYTINGVAVNVSPITTNIPTAAISPFLGFVRSAGTIAVSTIQIDLFYYTQTLTTPR